MRLPRTMLALSLLVATGPLPAADPSVDLYTAEVPLAAANEVPWQDPEAQEEDEAEQELTEVRRRERLIRLALRRVLVRLAGTGQVVADGMVRAHILERAGELLERYQYLASQGDKPARLRASFSAEGVGQALQETGWPLWGAPRPTLLVWVTVREDNGWGWAESEGYPELFTKVRRTARDLGLPLLIPLLDGTDRQQLSPLDILFTDWARIERASSRYEPDAILAVSIRPAEAGSREATARWALHYAGRSLTFRTGGGSGSGDWLAGGFKRIAAYWGHRFGVPPGELSSLEVAVEGVSSLETYAAVESAMAGISSIETVRLAGLSGGSARFRLRFQGRPVDLKQTLSLNQAFRSLGDGAQAGEQLLRFEYQP